MTSLTFPPDFLWGTATSAHQVEGNNVHSDWWAWEQAGRVKDRSGLACDHYRRFRDDFDLAASLGHTAHRFSIEWSRIEPEEGQWDDGALAHYVDVVRALRERRMEPIVTLHHFTSPQWLAAQGGWVNPQAIDRFARYVERVAAALHDQVRYWVTINEPMVYVRMHYIQGLGPPGARDFTQAFRVIRHLLQAHGVSYRVIHESYHAEESAPRVGIAHHFPVFRPCHRWWPPDQIMTALTDRLFNQSILDALLEGRWSVPGIATWMLPEVRNTLDYLGVNFYGRQFIHFTPRRGWPADSCDLGHHPREVRERTSMGWDVSPASFSDLLRRLGRLGKPILVTENGTFMTDDVRRWRFIEGHLQAMGRAIQQGAPIIGYCYWSLLDNFEWADGYGPRFGIVEVDYATQARRIRDSAHRYAEVCRTNRLARASSST